MCLESCKSPRVFSKKATAISPSVRRSSETLGEGKFVEKESLEYAAPLSEFKDGSRRNY